MSFTTVQQEAIDNSTFRTPELRALEDMAENQASVELERALNSSTEEQPFNLESDDVLDTNPAILQASQALGDAQKEALNIGTERMQYVESPIQICAFVSKAGPAINKIRQDVLLTQDPDAITALRMRSNS